MEHQIQSATAVIIYAVFGWLLLRAALSKPKPGQRAVYGWCAAITVVGFWGAMRLYNRDPIPSGA